LVRGLQAGTQFARAEQRKKRRARGVGVMSKEMKFRRDNQKKFQMEMDRKAKKAAKAKKSRKSE